MSPVLSVPKVFAVSSLSWSPFIAPAQHGVAREVRRVVRKKKANTAVVVELAPRENDSSDIGKTAVVILEISPRGWRHPVLEMWKCGSYHNGDS